VSESASDKKRFIRNVPFVKLDCPCMKLFVLNAPIGGTRQYISEPADAAKCRAAIFAAHYNDPAARMAALTLEVSRP
jgi:hypothetical protein